MELHKFYTGEAFNAHTYFGAHIQPDGTCTFRVYAPNALNVSLIGEFSNWEAIPMEKIENGGVYFLKIPAEEGMLYKYRIAQQDGRTLDRCDPYGFAAEVRPHTASRIVDMDAYTFHDAEWLANREKNYNRPMNIYEMHVGSWRREPDGSWYSYSRLCDELIAYLKDSGFTHVELMPLAEHPSDASWGYQVSGFFSATSRYGTPQELMAFIDRCHQENIGVILDFVPVHFAVDDFALSRFDGTALYEYPASDTGQSTWGSCNFNFYRGEVQSFIKSAAQFWIEKYHVDGLRFDAVNHAIYWQGDAERGVNEGAVDFLKALNLGLEDRYPNVMRIAEDSSNFLKVTAPAEYDGLGFDYKWDLGWMHDTLSFFEIPPDRRYDYLDRLRFSMAYFYQELYLLAFSHDEVVHGKKAILDKMSGTYEEKFAQARLLYLYMFTHPGKMLNFMGNELAHFREWDENRALDWNLLDYPAHREFNDYFKALGYFYRACPALYKQDYNEQNFQFEKVMDQNRAVLAFERSADRQRLLVVLNFDNEPVDSCILQMHYACEIHEIFSTGSSFGLPARKLKTVTLPGMPKSLQEKDDPAAIRWKKGRRFARYNQIVSIPLGPYEGVIFEIESK